MGDLDQNFPVRVLQILSEIGGIATDGTTVTGNGSVASPLAAASRVTAIFQPSGGYSTANGSAATLSLPAPRATLNVGDGLSLFTWTQSTGATPSGWTKSASGTVSGAQTGTLYTRVADGTEVWPLVLTDSSAVYNGCLVVVRKGSAVACAVQGVAGPTTGGEGAKEGNLAAKQASSSGNVTYQITFGTYAASLTSCSCVALPTVDCPNVYSPFPVFAAGAPVAAATFVPQGSNLATPDVWFYQSSGGNFIGINVAWK